MAGRIAAGGVSAQHCMTMDWSATMLAAAGVAADPALSARRRFAAAGAATMRGHAFRRPLHWRMNHRGQRALRDGDWKYLRVDGHDYLFNLAADERERANLARREPQRLAAMREAWEAWNDDHAADPGRCDGEPGLRRGGHAAALSLLPLPQAGEGGASSAVATIDDSPTSRP